MVTTDDNSKSRPTRKQIWAVWVWLLLWFSIFLASTAWDYSVWLIYGTHFMLSKHYASMENISGSVLGTAFAGFMLFSNGVQLLTERKWAAFIYGAIVFIFSGLPTARFWLFLTLHGSSRLLSKPSFPWLLMAICIAMLCKVKVWRDYIYHARQLANPIKPARFTVGSEEQAH